MPLRKVLAEQDVNLNIKVSLVSSAAGARNHKQLWFIRGDLHGTKKQNKNELVDTVFTRYQQTEEAFR